MSDFIPDSPMLFSDSDLADSIAKSGVTDKGFNPLRLRQAVVQSVQSGTITIRIAGGTVDIAGVVCLNVFPDAGETVWALQIGGMVMVIGTQASSTTTQSLPAGSMVDYGGAAAPVGWLLCNGASLLRTDYPALFTAISTSFGSVDGTHFTVPDFRGRVAVGTGAGSGLTSRTLAATGGEENHALSIAELASHDHESGWYTSNQESAGYGLTVVGTFANRVAVSGAGTAADINTQSTGSGTAHNNMEPYLVATKIIKT